MNEFIKNKHKRPWLLLDHATGVTDKSKNVRDDRSERRCRVGHVIVSASELPYMYLKPLQKLKGVGTGEAKKVRNDLVFFIGYIKFLPVVPSTFLSLI